MRRRWTAEAKRNLVEGAEKFKGSRAEYLRKVGVAPTQFYRFARDLKDEIPSRSAPQVLQLLGSTGGVSLELFFPSGHRLRVSGPGHEAAIGEIFRHLGAPR